MRPPSWMAHNGSWPSEVGAAAWGACTGRVSLDLRFDGAWLLAMDLPLDLAWICWPCRSQPSRTSANFTLAYRLHLGLLRIAGSDIADLRACTATYTCALPVDRSCEVRLTASEHMRDRGFGSWPCGLVLVLCWCCVAVVLALYLALGLVSGLGPCNVRSRVAIVLRNVLGLHYLSFP